MQRYDYSNKEEHQNEDGDFILFTDHEAAMQEKDAQVKEVDEEAGKARLILLLNHGHDRPYLDDGEMQCSQCGINDYDFRKPSLSELTKRIVCNLNDANADLQKKLEDAKGEIEERDAAHHTTIDKISKDAEKEIADLLAKLAAAEKEVRVCHRQLGIEEREIPPCRCGGTHNG